MDDNAVLKGIIAYITQKAMKEMEFFVHEFHAYEWKPAIYFFPYFYSECTENALLSKLNMCVQRKTLQKLELSICGETHSYYAPTAKIQEKINILQYSQDEKDTVQATIRALLLGDLEI